MSKMGVMPKLKSALALVGRVTNKIVSFLTFTLLDILDFVLCFVYKVADFLIEAECKPCYCSAGGNILLAEQGKTTKIVCLTNSKLLQEDISDTLYARPSLVAEVSKATVNELRRLKRKGSGGVRTNFTVNSTVVGMLKGKKGGPKCKLRHRWSDCDCKTCTSWTSSSKDTLFVRAAGAKGEGVKEDVVFIHGFISSSKFWTETVFPNMSKAARSKYRLIAVDLLGFGRSPKPSDSLYTLKEHVDMIERSTIDPNKVKSFHIVAHSLGCILALALAVRHPSHVKTITLLAPPYYKVPEGEEGTQYVLRRVAPRRVWPAIALGASIACWYEHISRTICLLICKNHRLWEFLTHLATRKRIRTYLMEGFFCHTHNAAWHTLHNIICGTANKIDIYLDIVRERLKCDVNLFHGGDDELLPVECSYNVQSKIPRAQVKVIDDKDHITIVVGRQKAFARELEQIWSKSSG